MKVIHHQSYNVNKAVANLLLHDELLLLLHSKMLLNQQLLPLLLQAERQGGLHPRGGD